MKRIHWAPVALSLAFTVGCGGGDNKTADAPVAANTPTAFAGGAGLPVASTNIVTPTDPKDIVRVFLDAMRAGNAEQLSALFSSAAREEIARQGIQIAPPGSAQATFEIQDAVPQGEAILVTSKWIEPPTASGEQPQEMEVLWVLRKETAGWRVCEMAVDPGTGEEYEVVNFEKLDEPGTAPAAQTPEAPATRVAALPGTPGSIPPAPPAGGLPTGQPRPQSNFGGAALPGAGFSGGLPQTAPATGAPNGALPGALPGLPPASLPQ
jgi:ketosteroid isomerase-like protein